jgi:hypothetical protein
MTASVRMPGSVAPEAITRLTAVSPPRSKTACHRRCSSSPSSPRVSIATPVLLQCHRSIRELLHDTPVPTSSTNDATSRSIGPAPVRSSAEPPPRALSGEPLLPEMPQSSPPPHCVALATIPNPPHRQQALKSGRPPPIPSPASAWASCCHQSCGSCPVLCQRAVPA